MAAYPQWMDAIRSATVASTRGSSSPVMAGDGTSPPYRVLC